MLPASGGGHRGVSPGARVCRSATISHRAKNAADLDVLAMRGVEIYFERVGAVAALDEQPRRLVCSLLFAPDSRFFVDRIEPRLDLFPPDHFDFSLIDFAHTAIQLGALRAICSCVKLRTIMSQMCRGATRALPLKDDACYT